LPALPVPARSLPARLLAAASLLGLLVAAVQPLAGASATTTTANHLDADTQGAESGTGRWAPALLTSISRSTVQKKAGTASLRVDPVGLVGWAVNLGARPGVPATPGAKVISFWALRGGGANLGASMRVHWVNAAQADLSTDTVTVAPLDGTWRQGRATVVAPAGTTNAWVEVVQSAGSSVSLLAGDHLYLDEFVVGDAPVAAPTSNAPTTPPAPMCGSAALNGPASPPAGAVAVYPGQNVYDATLARPAGTTFWLAPGVHTLEASTYAQVAAKTGNTYLGAPGAILDGQGINRYAFTYVAPWSGTGVTIRYLTIRNFVAPLSEGVVNQGAGPGWVVEYNTITNNGGAAVFVGSDNIVRNNCLTANSQYGFSMSGGLKNVVVDHNEISYNNTGDWEAKMPGCGCTGGGKFWDVNGGTVTNNWVHHNRSVGLWADTNNVAFRIEGNYINDNDGQAIYYEISYNFLIKDNTIKRNTWALGRAFAARGDYFPVGTIYIAESGGDARVSPTYATSEIVGNVLEDNWGGVALWESANRFCNSPNNTSAGYCTKGGAASFDKCAPATIATEPYYSDCRWKTQNIEVHHNTFKMNTATVGCDPFYCAKQALFSDYGTSPDWSPYKATVIQKAITFDRHNSFHDNAYTGTWSFTAYDGTLAGGFAAWKAAPYNQDAGSTLS